MASRLQEFAILLRDRVKPYFFTQPNKDNFITLQVKVQNSGTPMQLPDVKIADGFLLVVKAKKGNTGVISIGRTKSAAVNTTTRPNNTNPFTLEANESVKLAITNANKVWIDSTVSGDGVELLVEQD